MYLLAQGKFLSTLPASLAASTPYCATFRHCFKRATALLLVLSLTSSCTLVGAGIGAAIDSAIPGPYENRPGEEQWRLTAGDRVRLHLRDGTRVDGKYLGTAGPTPHDPEVYLRVDQEQVRMVAASEVRSVDVEVNGKGWLYGGSIGLLVDVTLVVVVCVAVSHMSAVGGVGMGGL
jgi:hypothetical protein